jgi:Zn-dependent protease with chaperone function
MRAALYFLFLVHLLRVQAQPFEQNYQPLTSYIPPKSYISSLCKGYDSVYKALDFDKRDAGRDFKKSLESIKKQIHSINDDSALMYNDALTNYLQSLVQHIMARNNLLPTKNYRVFTYRKIQPNAANYGNGIILVNLGLLAKLKYESNIAFILCHEISHDLKGHVIDGMIRQYQIVNDPAVKEKYEKLKKQEYNVYKSYEGYVSDLLQRINSKKREAEVQADSLGLILYANAGYDLRYAYETVEHLDSIDAIDFHSQIAFGKYFNSESQPFDRKWLEAEDEEETIGGGNLDNVKLADSLKTHPDCKYRLKKIQQLNLKSKENFTEVGGFENIRLMAQFEMLGLYAQELEISKGFYTCLQLYSENPGNIYLKANVVEYLYNIYVLKKNHYLSGTIDRPSASLTASYNETLNFMTNISPNACELIAKNFITSNFESDVITDPYVAYVYLLIKSINKTALQKQDMITGYVNEFGKNNYYQLLNKRLLKKTI